MAYKPVYRDEDLQLIYAETEEEQKIGLYLYAKKQAIFLCERQDESEIIALMRELWQKMFDERIWLKMNEKSTGNNCKDNFGNHSNLCIDNILLKGTQDAMIIEIPECISADEIAFDYLQHKIIDHFEK